MRIYCMYAYSCLVVCFVVARNAGMGNTLCGAHAGMGNPGKDSGRMSGKYYLCIGQTVDLH